MLIIRRSNCINISSGMFSLCEWLFSMHSKQSLTQTNRTRWCINTIRSPDDEHYDARNMWRSVINKDIESALIWSLARNSTPYLSKLQGFPYLISSFPMKPNCWVYCLTLRNLTLTPLQKAVTEIFPISFNRTISVQCTVQKWSNLSITSMDFSALIKLPLISRSKA